MSPLARRLARIARRRSLGAVARAARREVELRRDEAALARALQSSGPVVAGPFLGELGYELLYWRPYVHRLLRGHDVAPDRVTVLGRGGSGAWYGSVAARSVDAFEVVRPEALLDAAAARSFGSPKQLKADDLDRELVERTGVSGAAIVHPRFMYWRLRYLWEGLLDPGRAPELGDYDPLPRTELSVALEARLPRDYVAVKAYANECVLDAAVLAEIVAAVAGAAPVVLLTAPVTVDLHVDSLAADGVVRVDDLLEPAENLIQQAEIVARSHALLSTYGGFSYLGPFLGVHTVAFASQREANPLHEHVLRAGLPDASFTRVSADPAAVLRSLSL